MRVSIAIAALLGTFGLTAVEAADLSGRAGYYESYPSRAPQVVVYDVEPGTEIRAYWARPWQNRRYFPFTGKKPKVGRHEDLNAPRRIAAPAPTYYQEWSTLSLYPPHAIMPPADVAPSAPILPLK
ncbi:hypothetical protein [Undibacter mobilis]|uniref:Uncharacterized protein n=1 Tax=Undibacter mobilis TaxID=2292256 RepID=A0A371BCP7_9BRAD|nr:hypothetical protein [Undibacter mobilis]RDV05379.1 hypothetical protein DXH78_12830 [Undibacter mobilis]